MLSRFIILLILLSSCYSPRYVYSPVTQNIPLLSKKKDLKLGAYAAGGLGSNDLRAYKDGSNFGFDIHGAYAFTNHVAVMINFYNRWERNGSDNDIVAGDSIIIKYRRNLVEAGIGYFSSLGQNTAFQFFSGVSSGKFYINESPALGRTSSGRFHFSKVVKIFIQPAIISGMHQNFTAAFSSRFSMVNYSAVQTDYSPSELHDYFLSDLSSSPVFFWEPAMDYSFGFKKIPHIKLEVQIGLAILMNSRFVDYRTVNLGLGITTSL